MSHAGWTTRDAKRRTVSLQEAARIERAQRRLERLARGNRAPEKVKIEPEKVNRIEALRAAYARVGAKYAEGEI